MTNGDVIQDGWNNEAVKESLDLCLACKGCKSDCPTGVDVATYKAEFLSHYYESNRRPLPAFAFANIDLCAQAASHVPGLVNLTTQLPGLRTLARLAAGIPAQRRIPPFAPETFQEWWGSDVTPASRRLSSGRLARSRKRISADDLGDQRGRTPPAPPSCSGPTLLTITSSPRPPAPPPKSSKPLASTSWSPRPPLLRTPALRPRPPRPRQVPAPRSHGCPLSGDRQRTPIVVLEPSCAAVFRDELTNLFPNDHRAHALSKQVFLLSEFLEQYAKDFPIPKLATQSPRPRPLPSQSHHEDDRRGSRAPPHGHRFHRARSRMLRHGRRLRF